MKFTINLASRPYEDEGQFYQRWGTALGLMVLFTVFMVAVCIRSYTDSRKHWATASEAQSKLQELKREEAQAQQILAQPQNRGTRDRSEFLNSAIVRKSFSWTHLMTDLERVMPAHLRVVSLTPSPDKQNHFVLKVDVEGEGREGAIALVRNMERSQRFRSPELLQETLSKGRGNEAEVKSSILAFYAPTEPPTIQGGE
jgi:type IV pilus assembly protein PilN